MPRKKAHRCHKCGTKYLTARCPRCYPAKAKRKRGRSMGRSVRGRRAGWGLSFSLTPSQPPPFAALTGEETDPNPGPIPTGEEAEGASRIQYDYAE